MKISGIYQIQSKIHPDRIYIGSVVNIQDRWRHHLRDLGNNKHHSIKLQRHFNKYGEQDLQFSLVFECDKEILVNAEQVFIDHYDPWFNIYKIAGSPLGVKRSEETKKKYSINMMGNKRGAANTNKFKTGFMPSDNARRKTSERMRNNKWNEKPVIQCTLSGNPIKEWSSNAKASLFLGINEGNISSCRCGKRRTAGGFVWKHKTLET